MRAKVLPSASPQAAEKIASGLELLNRGDAAAALQPLREAADLDPASVQARYLLACAFHDLGRPAESEAVLRAALEREADDPRAVHRLGVVLSEMERWTEAVPELRRAARLQPDSGIVHRDLGVALLVMGEVDEARRAFGQAVELGHWGDATLYTLVRLTPMGGSDAEAKSLWRRLTELQARLDLTPEERTQLCFALGKAHADRGEVEQAAEAWAVGARLRRAGLKAYSVDPTLARWREIARIFDGSLLERLNGGGSVSDRPIFICGLPRSGTTLVEQILSAHPQVTAAGESGALPRVIRSVQTPDGAYWPQWATTMNRTDCRKLAEAYLGQLPPSEPGKLRTTDKRPENVEALGLLHCCFPNGALIYVKRDLRDVAFSCWTTLFSGGAPFTYDLAEMADYFRGNEALVSHWRNILPPGRLLEVPYEELVADPEDWSHRIVAHCGLDWDDRCLEPHKAMRPVTTASDAQVRRPIYGDSVGRWKTYETALKPFIDRLSSAAELTSIN